MHDKSRRTWWGKYLSGGGLSNKAISRGLSGAVRPQTKALDVSVGGRSIFARIALDFADVDHLGGCTGPRIGDEWDVARDGGKGEETEWRSIVDGSSSKVF